MIKTVTSNIARVENPMSTHQSSVDQTFPCLSRTEKDRLFRLPKSEILSAFDSKFLTNKVSDHFILWHIILSNSSSTGPYEILVRDLVAVDGADGAEILLIDSVGCPTDVSIMGSVDRINGNGQALEVPFDAFKFPSSDVVQFRALITPCVPNCAPVYCDVKDINGKQREVQSYGRRKRSSSFPFHDSPIARSRSKVVPSRPSSTTVSPNGSSKSMVGGDEDLVMVKTIKIVDSFDLPKSNRKDLSLVTKGRQPSGDFECEYIRQQLLLPLSLSLSLPPDSLFISSSHPMLFGIFLPDQLKWK